MESKNIGKAKGGYMRAARLTPEERKAIAQKAAKERWEPGLPRAVYKGTLDIGGIQIPCAVLDNGKRVLTENGITNALLGSRSGASKRIKKAQENDGAPIPLFLAPGNTQKQMNPFDELLNVQRFRHVVVRRYHAGLCRPAEAGQRIERDG